MRDTSSSFLSPITTTSICSVIICSSIILYHRKMEIGSGSAPTNKKYYSEESIQDVCFSPKSHYLINPPTVETFPISYQFAFKEIRGGAMEKKTLNSSWASRYFVLTPVRLLYFDDQQRRQLKGCFNLTALIQHKIQVTSSFPQISLNVTYQEQTKVLLVLRISQQDEYQGWLNSIKDVLHNIRTHQLHINIFPALPQEQLQQSNQKIGKSNCNFWNSLSISPQELLSYASHLDIIFLRSKSAFSYIHRFFMRSHYDHVGLLLKDEAERPYLLEVVNQKGVIISPLQNLLGSCSQQYQEIGYRKLIARDQQLSLDTLQDYINGLIGKKYELSLSKLFIDNQTQMQELTADSTHPTFDKQQKTYFCSELIADIYLKFGILVKGKSNNYWPKDFEEQELPLSTGYQLTPMMHIELHQEVDLSALEQ